jgi:hypothetical protein
MKTQVKEALDAELAKRTAPDYEHLYLHRGVLATPAGGIPVKRIGKGAFAEVYREQVSPGRVFAFTDDDVYDKEIAALVRGQQPDNPHVPAVEKFGHTRDKTVYAMPYYKSPLRKGDSPRGWEDFKKLEGCAEAARPRAYRDDRRGYEISNEVVDCAKESSVSPAVVEALEGLNDWAQNHSDQYVFEFSPQNLAADENGNLVLLDVLFERDNLARARRKAQEAREKRERAVRGRW